MDIGQTLLPSSTGVIDLGSTTLTFGECYLKGSGSNYHKITGTTPTGARVFTLPNASSNSVIPDTGAASNFLTAISSGGVISKAQPASSDLSDASNVALRNNTNSWSAAQIPDANGTRNLGSTSFAWGDIFFKGNSTFYHNLTATTPTAARTHTLPNANSNTVQPDSGASNNFLTAISSAGVISKAQPSSSNLSDSSNIALVNNNNNFSASQLPGTAVTYDLGSDAKPWKDIYIAVSGTNSHKITTTAPTADRTCTLPDANSNTVIPDTGASNNFLTAISSGGVISKSQPSSSSLSDSSNVALRNNSNSWSTAQLPSAQGTIDLGSDSFCWGDIYFKGNSTFSHKLTATTPTVDRVHTVPNADSNTVQPATGSAGQAVTGISSAGVIAFGSFAAVPTTPAAKTANFNASVGNTYRVDLSGGAFTATLDTAVGVAGQRIRIKASNVGGGQLTFTSTSSQTFDDGSTTSFTTTAISIGDAWEFESDGANWMIWG